MRGQPIATGPGGSRSVSPRGRRAAGCDNGGVDSQRPQRTYRDEAVVLRTQKLGEADRIVTLLTREHGQVRAVAKGIRRTNSKFGARLEPFNHVDIQLHHGRGSLETVTQVETIATYGRDIATDYEIFPPASVMVETAERLTADDEESHQAQYLLLVGAVHAMANRRHDPMLVLNSYMLRALAIAGWAPSCFDCASCGAPGPHTAFSIPNGGAICTDCRSAGYQPVTPGAMALLGDLLSGDWAQADVSAPQDRDDVGSLVSSYTQWHLERRLQSMRVLHTARS